MLPEPTVEGRALRPCSPFTEVVCNIPSRPSPRRRAIEDIALKPPNNNLTSNHVIVVALLCAVAFGLAALVFTSNSPARVQLQGPGAELTVEAS